MSSCLLLAGATADAAPDTRYYFSADLSNDNELEDCDAASFFRYKKRDPFELHERGANLPRARPWNGARWTRYSNPAGVTKTIERSRRAGMEVLLDLYYSEDWADDDKPLIPQDRAGIEDVELEADFNGELLPFPPLKFLSRHPSSGLRWRTVACIHTTIHHGGT